MDKLIADKLDEDVSLALLLDKKKKNILSNISRRNDGLKMWGGSGDKTEQKENFIEVSSQYIYLNIYRVQ